MTVSICVDIFSFIAPSHKLIPGLQRKGEAQVSTHPAYGIHSITYLVQGCKERVVVCCIDCKDYLFAEMSVDSSAIVCCL